VPVSPKMILPFILCSIVDVVLFPLACGFCIWGYMRLGLIGIALAALPAGAYVFYVSRFFGIAWSRSKTMSAASEKVALAYAVKALVTLAAYGLLAIVFWSLTPA
jgi:hypothetical protein